MSHSLLYTLYLAFERLIEYEYELKTMSLSFYPYQAQKIPT